MNYFVKSNSSSFVGSNLSASRAKMLPQSHVIAFDIKSKYFSNTFRP